MPGHDIIVIGASAGGVETLQKLVGALPSDLPAAVFIIQHTSPQSPGLLPGILRRAGPLPALSPEDRASIERGVIYVAPPDRHLLLERDQLRVVRGPKENRHRPSIDPLFRSAAWAFGPRVVGVVLSGTLDDGTAGLWAVKSSGGVAVVQDPADALYPDMPANALTAVEVDHCLPLDKIAPLLTKLARQPVKAPRKRKPPEKIRIETEFAMMDRDIKDMSALGKPSVFSCPSCGGSLWELHDGEVLRYRCHVGHAFSPESLLAEQSEKVEDALFSAVRAIEEKATVLRRMADRLGSKLPKHKADYEARAKSLDESAEILRHLLTDGKA